VTKLVLGEKEKNPSVSIDKIAKMVQSKDLSSLGSGSEEKIPPNNSARNFNAHLDKPELSALVNHLKPEMVHCLKSLPTCNRMTASRITSMGWKAAIRSSRLNDPSAPRRDTPPLRSMPRGGASRTLNEPISRVPKGIFSNRKTMRFRTSWESCIRGHLGLRKHRGDRLGKTLQAIDDGD
jgi:hypothetical protein